MKRSWRVPIAALVLLLGVGGLCAAWYVSTQRAFDAEVRLQSQQALRTAGDRELVVAESLAERLEALRRSESQRPFFHYQNLYHDPKGASQGPSVTPSPLAGGPEHPLVVGHFQIDSLGTVTLPTLNEELGELNAPDVVAQRALRRTLSADAAAMRGAAVSLLAQVEQDAAATDRAARRIAQLEARLADVQRAETRREELRRAEIAQAEAQRAEAQRIDAQRAEAQRRETERAELERIENEKATLQRNDQQRRSTNQGLQSQRADQVSGLNITQLQVLEPSAFEQNVNSNFYYQQLKQTSPAPSRVKAPVPIPTTVAAPQVEILTSDLEWRTVEIGGKARLMAMRAVRTPAGTLVQGVLTALADGHSIDGAIVRRGDGSAIEGTGWRVRLPAEAGSSPLDERRRFLRMFASVSMVLLLVVAGVIWTLWRAETLALDRTRFAATAAHELRTPLASLRLYSDLIAEEEDPANRERYARELAAQTERLGRVVANVLEVTRIERGAFAIHPRPGEIGPAVEECIDRLRPQLQAASCPIHVHVAADLPQVSFDADAIHHVVDNLVDNAEKYSREMPERSISIDVASEDGGVSITVADRGPGVPDNLIRAPQPFRRGAVASSPAGLGLGLFLVNRIVLGHGGVIGSTPRAGGGASVRVFLPAFYKP